MKTLSHARSHSRFIETTANFMDESRLQFSKRQFSRDLLWRVPNFVPNPLKILVKIAVEWEDLNSYWRSEKSQISQGDQQPCYLQVFQRIY